jgi:hypothetical protein
MITVEAVAYMVAKGLARDFKERSTGSAPDVVLTMPPDILPEE